MAMLAMAAQAPAQTAAKGPQWLIENSKKYNGCLDKTIVSWIVNINYWHGPYLAQNNDGNSGWKR